MLPTAPIRVLIADDIPELRTLLRTTLQGRGFQLVGEAGDGRETLAQAVDREPDVVVLDFGMRGIAGPDLVAELLRRAPAVRVVALSAFADTEQRRRALDQGAHASLDKDIDPDQLVATLREVCGRAFGPVALPPREGLEGLAADELERVWSTLPPTPTGSASRSPSGPWPPARPRPPPPSSACPPSACTSRSTTSAPATRPWPRSSTCRCPRSRSTGRSWPASTSTPPTTPWSRPSSASATPSA